MTRLNWQAMAVFFGAVLAAALVVSVYDAVMYDRHGNAGTISNAMTALGRRTNAFPAAACLLLGLVVGYLICHWWE